MIHLATARSGRVCGIPVTTRPMNVSAVPQCSHRSTRLKRSTVSGASCSCPFNRARSRLTPSVVMTLAPFRLWSTSWNPMASVSPVSMNGMSTK